MARTQLTGEQIKDGHIYREDLNSTTTTKAVITKVIAGTGINISETGVDSGTGDVTINSDASGWNNLIKNNNYTAVNNDYIFIDATSTMTITLPSSPQIGDRVKATDISGILSTNNCTIARNGSNIMGLSENFDIDANYVTCTFYYLNSTFGWGIEF